MKFLDFINKKKENEANRIIMNEGFGDKDLNHAIDLITSLLKKNISGKVVRLDGSMTTAVDGKECTSVCYIVDNENSFQWIMFNWLNSGGSNDVYSISISDDYRVFTEYKGKANVTIYTMGASVVYFLPLIYHSINAKDYKLDNEELRKYAKNVLVKESSYRTFYIGAQEYHIYEGLSDEYVFEQYMNNIERRIEEAVDPKLRDVKRKLYSKVKEIRPKAKEYAKAGHPEIWQNLDHDYYSIVRAIKGGAETIEDLDIEFKSNITLEILMDDKDKELEKKIKEEVEKHEDPEVAWKEMRQYVKMVIKGMNPSVIICGAPGAGKTFKVKKELKLAGYVEGQNLCTIKGKCTPRQLYLTLYNYQDKGDIIVIDDADSLVGPKAPEDVINILKGALDSTSDDEGRLVSYMIAGKLEDEEGDPVPKRFYYRGGVIIITNYRAGQLDTALKGRSFVQDINFTLDDMMELIKRLMPDMGNGRITKEAKFKAFDHISKLAKSKNNDIEISLRTFNICCTLYQSTMNDPDFTDEETANMVTKLLKLQAARGGKKY